MFFYLKSASGPCNVACVILKKYPSLGSSQVDVYMGTPIQSPLFNSRSGQITYFHGVKTRFSSLGTGDVPRGSDST